MPRMTFPSCHIADGKALGALRLVKCMRLIKRIILT